LTSHTFGSSQIHHAGQSGRFVLERALPFFLSPITTTSFTGIFGIFGPILLFSKGPTLFFCPKIIGDGISGMLTSLTTIVVA
jgi:hypothetical protein